MKKTIYLLCISAFFTSFLAVLSQIYLLLPLNVPLTLQIFGVALSGYMLGAKWSVASMGVYILLGAMGVPIFSGFKGGFQVLTGPTGGFIFGFLAISLACGIAVKIKKRTVRILLGAVGVAICHIWGIVQFYIVSGIGFFEAVCSASLPFIVKDCLLVAVAYRISKGVEKRIKI